ncbi:MAG: hypothetical protein HY360_25105 [Verrucomicrobia bacterium]|nr:hypothetical protein [Verrucomicrobiota bacterium]
MNQPVDDALTELASALKANPACDGFAADLAAQEGRPRPHPMFHLNRQADPNAGEGIPKGGQKERRTQLEAYTPERLAVELCGLLAPLKLHNPIRPLLGLGVGPGTATASFGCRLDPDANFCPSNHISVAELLATGCPDPAASGIMPSIREKIEVIKAHTPSWVKISMPDLQGPFNIIHMVVGNDVFILPQEEPETFRQGMTVFTDFFLAAHRMVSEWIGPERLDPYLARRYTVAECSTNMVSPEFYREHILAHDRRVAENWGRIAIHTCSGPHVFFNTLRHLPHVIDTEAGRIPPATSGWTDVDVALAEIGARPIILRIGSELPEGDEESFIRRDLDRLATNPRLQLGYVGMYWKKKDEDKIREMHLKLNEYYRERIEK